MSKAKDRSDTSEILRRFAPQDDTAKGDAIEISETRHYVVGTGSAASQVRTHTSAT